MNLFWEQCKAFWNDEEGLGTLEILLIIAVLIAVAILFKNNIETWVKDIMNSNSNQIDEIIDGGGE
ncbi:hypothetical protein G4V62_05580 [Bacillaceae bacterium SIJ1]|uniref:Flp1 family type IVb pilin n=1 Tax=Litoribacterium kuwaitense TaxID=1398745 RepID=UPI0013ECA45B|nr:Flp1 family type IVb pilin [Litoribacterium kuwaitense]NGP44452.1 hypothetical protein [Litoribacterium kuwaitense]